MSDKPENRAPDPWAIFGRTGTPDDMLALDNDIENVADQLIAALTHADSKPVSTQPDGLKPEDVRFLAYALATYRSRRNQTLTEHHLRLLAAALAVKRPSLAAASYVGLPAVKKLTEFLTAADEQARDPKISENSLAKKAGVSNKTIRVWRKMPEFVRCVRVRRFLAGERTVQDNEIAASWANARRTIGK